MKSVFSFGKHNLQNVKIMKAKKKVPEKEQQQQAITTKDRVAYIEYSIETMRRAVCNMHCARKMLYFQSITA